MFGMGMGKMGGGRGAAGALFTADASAWTLPGSPVIDLDFENSQFWINGKAFTSLAAMLIEGTLRYNTDGTTVFRLDTALSGPTYYRMDHTTPAAANAVATAAKGFYELWDAANGGDLGAGTPQNNMACGRFWDGANHVLTWTALAAGVDQTSGTTWTKTRGNQSRGYLASRNDLNLHSHTANNISIQTDTSCAIVTGLDRLMIGNRRALDRPSNVVADGEAIHRFTVWQGTVSNANVQALSTRQVANLLSYSEDLSNAAWTRTSTNITANAINGPRGTQTADLMTEVAGSAIVTHAVTQVVAGWNYTGYIDLKRLGTTWVRVICGNPTTNGFEMWVNLLTGAKGVVQARGTGWTLVDTSVVDLGDGFFRCIISFIPTDNTASISVMTATADGSSTRQNSTYYVGGAQINPGSVAQPYVLRAA